MALNFQEKKIRGCSGCLIQAIVRGDEQRLRHLLSIESAQFSDIYWIPIESLDDIPRVINTITYLPDYCRMFNQLFEQQCTHSMLAETLPSERPANIAISVVLMSMMYTTGEFNALQMLIDSHKFDLSEPLLFHVPCSLVGRWRLLVAAADPVGMAMLFEGDSVIDDANSFPLLTTLVRRKNSSRLDSNPLEMRMRLMLLWVDSGGYNRSKILRANGALSFLYGYSRRQFFYSFIFDNSCVAIFLITRFK